MADTPTLLRSETQVNTTDAAVGAGGTDVQDDGQIVALADGGYLIVWTDHSRAFNPAGSAVIGQRYDLLGNRVGGEFDISQLVTGDQSAPAVTALPDGGILVAFVDSANNGDIFVRRYDADLNQVGTDTIDNSAATTTQPSLTAFADGSYVVAYTVGAANTDIEGRLVSPAGAVGAPFTIFADANSSDEPELTTLSNGNFVVVFRDDDNFLEDTVRFRVLQPNGTGVAQGSVSGSGQEDSDADVAALRDGGFVIAHRVDDFMASDDALHVTIFDNNANIVREFEPALGPHNDPDLVALSDGGFLVTWEAAFGDALVAQRSDAAGNLVGSRFTVHQDVTFDGEVSARAALLQDGRFAYAIRDPSSGDLDVTSSIWGADFDAGALGDILWQYDNAMVATVEHEIGAAPGNWRIEATRDFDADGDTDILWRHVDGLVVVWEVEDGQFVTNHNVEFASAGWEIEATGDFDGDSDADVLWRHQDGAVVTWEIEDNAYVQNHNIEFASVGWRIEGTGDFDGDGDDDIIWRHQDGAVVTWEMEDGAYVQNHNIEVAATTWEIEGTGDFDGDGDDDILWRHQDGAVVTWEMGGGEFVQSHSIEVASAGWRVEGTHDFDSDGDAGILWRHTDGDVVIWDMQGGELFQVSNVGFISTTSQIRGTGEFDLA
jgi:FG-GAP-like repeat